MPYVHVVVRGDARRARDFLAGAAAGAGCQMPVFGIDEARREAGPGRRFAACLHLVPQITEALIPESLLPLLRRALVAGGPGELSLESARPVRRAEFVFKFRVFGRAAAAAIRRLLDGRPAGVELLDFEPRETADPQAEGVELYTPAHDYEFSGSGRLAGELEGLLGLHQALLELAQVRVEPIDLDLE